MNITAVVVTYNRKALLQREIESLRHQKLLSAIIVVNNGSTDGTAEWLATQHDLTVINQDNVGGSGGFYTGIQRAFDNGAEWIWCMDDDVFPHDNCLDALVKVVREYPDTLKDTEPHHPLGIVAPHRLLEGETFTHEFQHFNFTNPFASVHGSRLKPHSITTTDNYPIVGCDFEGPFIHRSVVEKIGLPNKELFIFCDDTEYCLRAHQAGFALLYAGGALMDKHKFFSNDNWTTRNQKKKWKRYYQVRNEAFLNHHYGQNWGVRYLRSWIGVIGYILPAVITMPFTRAWQPKDLSMLWQAYSDGIHERLGKR